MICVVLAVVTALVMLCVGASVNPQGVAGDLLGVAATVVVPLSVARLIVLEVINDRRSQ